MASSSLLSTAYLGPVSYYARLLTADVVRIEAYENFQKQTFRNRCIIATPAGPQALTIPIVHTGTSTPIRDVELSTHGTWTHLHWQALVSAYRQSPFFDYYEDYLRPFYEHPPRFLWDFNEGLRATICELLDIATPILTTNDYIPIPPHDIEDCRTLISPRTPSDADTRFHPVPYYQVFTQRTGFLPNLSICDLLFNMGPESRIVLRKSILLG